jgi:hypothetical protein
MQAPHLFVGKIKGLIEDMLVSKPVEQYLKHVESITGGEGDFYKITDPSEPLISIVSYRGVPEPGWLTAFSYGLSSASIPEWKLFRQELVICVKSNDVAWALAVGEMIRNGRGREQLFLWGGVLNFGQAISDESEMSAFFPFECTVLDESDLTVTLSDRTVRITQLYPIYEEEIPFIEEVGVERFFNDFDIDFFDVKRKRKTTVD